MLITLLETYYYHVVYSDLCSDWRQGCEPATLWIRYRTNSEAKSYFMSRARGVPTLMNYYEQADDQHTP